MRRAFTLIELLTVVAIIAIMVGAAVASVSTGRKGARVRAATRDIFATIRHARSIALVTQQPSVITYSTDHVDDEVCARITIDSAKIFNADTVKTAVTLYGETVSLVEDEPEPEVMRKSHTVDGEDAVIEKGGGETMEEILFAPISDDVVKGIRIKVTKEDEELDFDPGEAKAKSKISVFSNVDYIIGKYNEAKAKEKAKAEKESADEPPAGPADADQEEVSFVWQTNGRTDPHRVWIYPDGGTPENGLSIKIDRFGAAKVLGYGEDD